MNAVITPDDLDWEAIFRDYHCRLHVYIKRRIHSCESTEELAEDLASEVFVKAIEAARRGYGPKTHLSGWLFRIARCLIIDEYRRRDKWGASIELESLGGTACNSLSPFEEVVSMMGCDAIWHNIGLLTEKQARIITLKGQEGYTSMDIAREVDMPENVVRGLIHRGRVHLKELLATKDYEP